MEVTGRMMLGLGWAYGRTAGDKHLKDLEEDSEAFAPSGKA